ncbi:hypothetical protein CSIM01_11361 [Colletotrichum simmondsii]|uniref:Uncharacterized protein n=1 Tax=Colletotrichum simmondsii TaxID=703756 RepID=A0A135THY1_9PEZI|nr:hypothetical protein CSIM01_11361 [Colletotrichum simmondsii]
MGHGTPHAASRTRQKVQVPGRIGASRALGRQEAGNGGAATIRWHGWWKESSTRRPDLPPRALSIGSRTASMSHPICLDGRGGGRSSCSPAAVPRLSHPLLAVPSRSLVCALTLTGYGPWRALGLDSMASWEYRYGESWAKSRLECVAERASSEVANCN